MNDEQLKTLQTSIGKEDFYKRKKALLFEKKILHLTDKCAICLYRLKETPDIKLIIKKVKKSSIYIENSCIITKKILNKLRTKLPHFRYTFGYEKYRNKRINLYLEYLQGKTFHNFLSKKNIDSKIFLNLLSQILCTLEQIQQRHDFVHFDFHLKNILVCPCSKEKQYFKYKIYNEIVAIENLGFKIMIIDFDFAICHKKIKDEMFDEKLVEYGYVGIFLAGCDLLRFLFCLKKFTLEENHSNDYLNQFTNIIFKDFLKLDTTLDSLQKHEKLFFNMTHKKQIYLTPLHLILFLQNNKDIPVDFDLKIETGNLDNIYIPLLSSSKDSIRCFIHRFENIQYNNNNSLQNIYLKRIVKTLKLVLEMKIEFKSHKDLQQIKYLG